MIPGKTATSRQLGQSDVDGRQGLGGVLTAGLFGEAFRGLANAALVRGIPPVNSVAELILRVSDKDTS